MPRATAVIFDMDGLLVDSESVYQRVWQATAESLGYEMSDAWYHSLTGTTLASGERAILDHFGQDFPLDAFREQWVARWHASARAGEMPAKPGALALLETLAARGVPMALGTSSDESFVTPTLEGAGIRTPFGARVTGERVEQGKPAPDIFLEAARGLGVPPEQCIVLEDSQAGASAGLAANMHVIVVPDLQPPAPENRAALTGVHASLTDAMPQVLDLLGLSDAR
jgi:HAD superfamily hydrolase (TIGR01509 family)